MEKLKEKIAYFCMEYGLNDHLPLYAGGLGILAGDYLKAARELQAPIVGIGILWWKDYTRQLINEEGYPYDTFPTIREDGFKDTGKRVKVRIEGRDVELKIHLVDSFNHAPLYLLDAGRPETENGWITEKLYSEDKYTRIAQEIVLGIGGVRALKELGITVDRYHFNEGHAAFAGIELIREKIDKKNLSFAEAVKATRQQIIFTTHTPIPAGNESHDLHLLEQVGAFNGLNWEQMKQLGGEPFNMTAACLHMSSIANGVSQVHGETARRMWEHLEKSAQIIAVTNGVDRKTWQREQMETAFLENGDLWAEHYQAKKVLVDFVRRETAARMNPDNLIIGFARRAAPYKRSELIFRDTKRIDDLLKTGKIQLVFSGKAHPNDHYGKDIVAALVQMDRRYKDSVVFLENYDMEICRYLVQGCDVWLNNPKRPMEASGTSGMKAAMNGVLNLSVLDGWVAEGPEHGINGWVIDQLFEQLAGELNEDEKDLQALYLILRNEVIPLYYEQRERWVEMMRASIAMSHRKFSAVRMLKDYYQLMYRRKETEAVLV